MFSPDVWQNIKTLSEMDSKTTSQKVLKVAEELGELSGKAQPFDGLDGTHHRIVELEELLEEAVDGVLANLSIPLSLGCSPDDVMEMMAKKISKWANLQRSQAIMKDKIPYEIHVTVDKADQALFRQACTLLGVKPIILALQAGQDTIEDVMTSSTFMGNNQGAMVEMQRIVDGLQKHGLKVVRRKIETVPWHPKAPSLEFNNTRMPENCYFESHIAAIITDETIHAEVQRFCRKHGLHLSRNAFKTYQDGTYKLMMTYRAYEGTREDFERTLAKFVGSLSEMKDGKGNALNIDKVITEFSLFDSTVDHDADWLKANVK